MHTQFAVNLGCVELDCTDRDDQFFSDLPVGQPIGDQLQHFLFSRGERLHESRGARVLGCWGESGLGCSLAPHHLRINRRAQFGLQDSGGCFYILVLSPLGSNDLGPYLEIRDRFGGER